ncbi:hypothetical protein QJS66_18005 [Kocuria rhizophila]|nr:hypothetical protein QJS66_18005 [Kocuria rhizophila]
MLEPNSIDEHASTSLAGPVATRLVDGGARHRARRRAPEHACRVARCWACASPSSWRWWTTPSQHRLSRDRGTSTPAHRRIGATVLAFIWRSQQSFALLAVLVVVLAAVGPCARRTPGQRGGR